MAVLVQTVNGACELIRRLIVLNREGGLAVVLTFNEVTSR